MPPIPHTFAAPHRAPHTRPARHNFNAIYPACRRLVNGTGAGYRRFGAIRAGSQQRKFPRSTRVLDANRDSPAGALKCFLPDCVRMGTLQRPTGGMGNMVHRPVAPNLCSCRQARQRTSSAIEPVSRRRNGNPQEAAERAAASHAVAAVPIRTPPCRPRVFCNRTDAGCSRRRSLQCTAAARAGSVACRTMARSKCPGPQP